MAPNPKLDRIDLKILVELQKNGQLLNIQLAELVGLSPSPCLQRVKRLEAAGYIMGYGARISVSKLVENITVFTEVTLNDHRREDFVKFEASIRSVDELMKCHLISGGYDYLPRFLVRNVAHYQTVIDAVVNRNIGISKYFSYIVLNSPLIRAEAPIASLLAAQER
jgi:DNA-binding Lrp family transcriptional regulator